MAFRVEIAPRAFSDLDGIAACIKERGSHESGRRWFNGIVGAIGALGNMPSRCPVAEESEELGQQVHLLLHGRRNRSYKVYYSIHDETQTVRVFHVRHWARKSLRADDLQELIDDLAGQEEDA